MKKKSTAVLVLLAVILLMCSSCKSDKRTLEVTSYDYQGLKQFEAGEIKARLIPWHSVDNPYIDYSCYITVENGKLKVENHIPDEESSIMWGNYGYFVGVNVFEEGWVCYYPYAGYWAEEVQEPQLVVGENCLGFIRLDKENGYVVTFERGYTSCVAHLYSLEYSEAERKWVWNCEATIDDGINTYPFDPDEQCIYIFTNEGIECFSIKDKTLRTVKMSRILKQHIYANSAVKLNGKLYCGSPMGIYEYDIDTDEEFWYLMDYEKYVGEVTQNK